MSRFLLAFALAALATSAHAADKGLYLGASLGRADVKDVTGDFNFSAHDLGYKLYGGFRFADRFGIEGGYVDFGSPDDDTLGEHINGNGHAVDAFAVGFLPLAPIDLYAKLGLVSWNSRFRISDLDFTDKHDGTDLAYGVGAQFRVGSAAVRAEYEGFEIGDRVNMLSVGVSWTFF